MEAFLLSKICNKNSTGFTLVEVLIVTLMVGVLATIFATSFNVTEKQKEQRDLARLNELSKYASALEMYFADNNSYPSSANVNNTCLVKDVPYSCTDFMIGTLSPYAKLNSRDEVGCPFEYFSDGTYYSLSIEYESNLQVPSGQVVSKNPYTTASTENCELTTINTKGYYYIEK
jgi:prepilin-type N-terminal cleavage/methylation domain-containing protein